MYSCDGGREAIVKLLLSYGADPKVNCRYSLASEPVTRLQEFMQPCLGKLCLVECSVIPS